MFRLVLLLVLSSALLLGGCKKDEPEPDSFATIVGTEWNMSYVVVDYYDPAGTFIRQWKVKGPWARVESLRFSASTIENYRTFSFYFAPSLPYTRKGNQLSITFPADQQTLLGVRIISRLTADSLTLELRSPESGSGPYAIIQDHYYRQ